MKILGLDLGVGSVGWSLIEADENRTPIRILNIGSRIVSLTPDESNNFNKGSGETICCQRTAARTARKGNWRYKMRRALLRRLLKDHGMLPPEENNMPPLKIWGLRSSATTPGEKLSLTEIGRVLLHLNQKRGYKHAKSDNSDSKQTEYVSNVNKNYKTIKDLNLTVGQYFYSLLKDSFIATSEGKGVVTYRIKENVFPRQAYIDEFDAIIDAQKSFYPAIFTPEFIEELKEAIFFQRPLKSCKHLISICEFEKRNFKNRDGKNVETGPKVAPRTSPIAQATRIYETINNLRLVNPHNLKRIKDLPALDLFESEASKEARLLKPEYVLDKEERDHVFEFLNTHEKMTATDLLKILGLKKSDGFKPDKALGKGIKGNDTFVKLSEALGSIKGKEQLLSFNISLIDSNQADQETGEIIKVVSPSIINEPLYKLWHTVYSISDKDELASALSKNFGISDPEIIDKLFSIDFVKPGFSNRSAKFMRKILPYMMEGIGYSDACSIVGVNHSDSLTIEQNNNRQLAEKLEILPKNTLRQPTVEKIINQMINVVNELISKYGEIDEARVELARSLKQSADERAQATLNINMREKQNKAISDKIIEHGIIPSRNKIQKYRMWEETGHTCMYCGQTIGVVEFLNGENVEVEHIIPRSIFFDDSFSNKTCACRECNKTKNNQTAYDFMNSKSEEEFSSYVNRVERLFSEKKISKTKHDRLLTSSDSIPTDFLERDLRQSQYISKKAREILLSVIRNVWASSGSVTDYFRHEWGYDRILHDLNLPKYQEAGLVKEVEFKHKGQTHKRLQIIDWSKRLDHRHHAIDALVIAQTTQAFVQRLNNLNSEHGNLHDELVKSGYEFKRQNSLLSLWASSRAHFDVATVNEIVAGIAVSFKAGKKLSTPGKRRYKAGGKRVVVQSGIQIPRGALHQETVYGIQSLYDGKKTLKYAFENPDLIVDLQIKHLVEERIRNNNGDWKQAHKQTSKSPIEVKSNGKMKKVIEVDCFKKIFVKREAIASLNAQKISAILDAPVRSAISDRFAQFGGNEKQFQKSIEGSPIMHPKNGLPIKKVRIATGLKPDSMVVIRKDKDGRPIGYAKTSNNHHVAFYEDENGKVQTLVSTFWTAMQRKLNGISPIIQNVDEAWDHLLSNINDEIVLNELASTMPQPHWKFLNSMQMNEMFVLGLSEEEYLDAVRTNDTRTITSHLYRVQKLSLNDYNFRFHTATSASVNKRDIMLKDYLRVSSYNALVDLNIHKIKINVTGEITYD